MLLNKLKMQKQKQIVCCPNRRRAKIYSRNDRSNKKNLQILETYVVSPPKGSDSAVYELVEKNALEELKQKPKRQYVILNPKTKYVRHSRTEVSQTEDEYLDQLKGLKKEIRNLQKQVEQKRAQQEYEGQYLSEIKSIKSEIQELKNLQKEMEEKRAQLQQEDEYISHLESLKSEIKDLHQEIKEKKSPHYLPPIHIHPAVNLNPEIMPMTLSKKRPEQPVNRRSYSVHNAHNDDLDNLREEVQQLRRELTLDKKFKHSNSPYLPKMSRVSAESTPHVYNSAIRDFAKNNFSIKKLDSVTVNSVNPRAKTPANNQMSETGKFKMWKKQILASGIRKVRNVVNVIYFARNLQRFAQRIRMKRENFFRDSFQQNIYNQVTLLKDTFVKSTQEFIQTLPITQQQLLVIVASDGQKQRDGKIDLTKKYINIFLDAIRETEFSPHVMQTLTETCYFVCRHGSAGVLSNYFTSEELDIMCVSKASLKVCSEKNLQKSHIISFVWIKLIVFNILLRTETIKEFGLDNNPVWNTNFFLFGSIIYEITRKLQAQLIQKVPLNYIIGNWKHINFINSKISMSKKAINPSKSMVISFKPVDRTILIDETPNELVQGTMSKVFLNQAYQLDNWDSEERKITNYVNLVHRRICKYHAKLKQEL